MEVKNQLEDQQKNREVMEVRLVHDQKLLKESMMALVSHLQNPKVFIYKWPSCFNFQYHYSFNEFKGDKFCKSNESQMVK
ncbi:hypothetical protein MTR67_034613 [Solanum verrucosum]|uniref:Uncharacterized protein n=1 Tax=Solanum verrucosum TaxID=315347 RepID=A0AAF0U845_SOLVR|nr:hypothetical protein MTR67_034613 [Solanum verrucosum]